MDYSRECVMMTNEFLSDLMTITSNTAVGKTKTIEALKKCLGPDSSKQFVSGGSIMRGFAKELGMTIEQFAEHSRLHPKEGYDKRCDEEISRLGLQNHTVIEGRLPHVFAPKGFKVLLTCPLRVRAERRHKDFPNMTFENVLRAIEERDESDRKRYEKLYPGCVWPEEDFDLVVSTSSHSPEAVAEAIVQGHAKWWEKVSVCSSV